MGTDLFWDEQRRPTPKKTLKKMVYERDHGKCRICAKKVDPFSFEIGHNIAHSKGGKLTLKNTILLCSTCNRSMRTLSLKQVRKKLGLPESPEEISKRALRRLKTQELRYLAKRHRIQVRRRKSSGFFSQTKSRPSKIQYINALAKEITKEQIDRELKDMPKEEPKAKRRKRRSSFF